MRNPLSAARNAFSNRRTSAAAGASSRSTQADTAAKPKEEPATPKIDEDAVPPPQPMWGNSKPKGKPSPPLGAAEVEDEPTAGDDPGAMPAPKPMWGNKAPKPMWGNVGESSPSKAPESMTALDTSGDGESPYMDSGEMGKGETRSVPRKKEVSMADTPTNMTPGMQGRMFSQSDGVKPKKYIKQYEMGVTLGKGSYAKVKMCINTDNGQTFAVKIFNKSLLKRRKLWDSTQSRFKTAFDDVMREIAIMKKLQHDNVMNMYDVIDDTSVNKLYMVMDFCRQGAIMESSDLPCAPLERWKCLSWFADSVVGLDYLHFQGVVHFDLKPDNILVADDNRAVISDFGVSRVLNPGAEEGHQSEEEKARGLTRGSPGTPSYTAPEVWGSQAYHGKTADVWSLGVTLHAMVFGTLPYFAQDQQELIKMVTAPEPWTCAHEESDTNLIDLLSKMLQKNPLERVTLEQVKVHPWLEKELASRKRVSVDEYAKIVVNDDELREAVISGHVANFRRNMEMGTLAKLTPAAEGARYRTLLDASTGVGRWLPKLMDVKQSTGRRVILEMEDLTHNVQGACLMDIKMGTRTFTEEDVASMSLRPDLLDKMKKMEPSAVTPEEEEAGGITKMRYLQFREESTTTKELGFRIDAVQLSAEAPDAGRVPDAEELRSSITTVEKVRETIELYVQKRPQLISSFLPKLRDLRTSLENCHVFASHEFVRTSILLVYSNATNSTTVHIIDLTRVSELLNGKTINHRDEWAPGNHEDGYLVGLDNLISTFEKVLEDLS